MNSASLRSRQVLLYLGIVILGAFAVLLVVGGRGPALPSPGSAAYEQVTRAFYYGLAALEVGLLDDARQKFTEAATLVPEEPASWANLALARLRLGELEEAAEPIERAIALDPDNSELVLLAARMEAARGRVDESVARLREAVRLDVDGLRTRFALADELQRLNDPASDDEALVLLDEVIRRSPGNIAALIERARVAARRGDLGRVAQSRAALAPLAAAWPDQASEQYRAFEQSVEAGRLEDAVRATTFLRNVLARVPAFLESLAAVRTPAELVAEPFDRFLALTPLTAQPSPADSSIRFVPEAVEGNDDLAPGLVLPFYPTLDVPPLLLGVDAGAVRLLEGSLGSWPFPSSGPGDAVPASAVAALDWNHDFRTDIAVAGRAGIRLLLQSESGLLSDVTTQASANGAVVSEPLAGVWAADIEMDGDLDLVAAPVDGGPFVLRNNGDLTWRRIEPFTDLEAVRWFGWADLDRDADPDAVFLDRAGAIHVFANRQAGAFARAPDMVGVAAAVAVTMADLDADGAMDILALEGNGTVRRMSWTGADWSGAQIASWTVRAGSDAGSHRLLAADLDNNGALDLVASGGGRTGVWLGGVDRDLIELSAAPEGEVFSAADRNRDGRIDLAGIRTGRPVWLMGAGGRGDYHWKAIQPRAQQNAGDQRINAFGVGGEITVRSGLLVQTQIMTGAPVHFGLGAQQAIDVARIVWPNGVAQAEFGAGVDDAIVAEQRLKGSCPWVFAWDGARMGFVTDFLWRSPLGLRINARDTAGVTQTEDWVKLRGDQLQPRDGHYDIRITAELWESHFFDHVSLMAVDRPDGTDVFVDERFSATSPQAHEVRILRVLGPVVGAQDEHGRDVTELVSSRDERYLATFARGRYQGIADEHFVEFEVERAALATGAVLVANGWTYPTDSSINMAIGQSGHVTPGGLALEARRSDGSWVVLDADLGFPAGKRKTMLIGLPVAGSNRFRLRTRLEVYWDSLQVATEAGQAARSARLALVSAELRFRGYSTTTSPRNEAPETPVYERLANVTQRWRDLTGYHTRWGDVAELLSNVDDRYVIMNAGDELRLEFPALPPTDPGWRRDFILIGDGWEKDGDYNTGFSRTVLPLPSHDRPAYGQIVSGVLEDDPVYQRHHSDWERYHTRFVTPRSFVRGLR
jgi:tetratricopeptide (TPR) repeat protein